MPLLGGKALSVPLPEIVRKDIGKDTGGVTVKELCQLLAKDTVGEVAAAAAKAVGDLGKATVEEATQTVDEAGKTVEKVGEGLKSVFK